MLEHKGYRGAVTFDDEAGIFHGEVVDTRDVITFQGKSVAELTKAFKGSIEEYLKVCAERKREPDKPFSGKIPLRVPPDIHRAVAVAARTEEKSLNAWLTETLAAAVDPLSPERLHATAKKLRVSGRSKRVALDARPSKGRAHRAKKKTRKKTA